MKLSHLTNSDQPRMVDISEKTVTAREAVAQCRVELGEELLAQITNGELKNKKGPVFHTAILAGIQGTKLTSQLIPLCHPLPLTKAEITIEATNDCEVSIHCLVRTTGKTGVEMEALTGASIAALTLYDMCKSANPGIVIRDTKLLSKKGGKSDFNAS